MNYILFTNTFRQDTLPSVIDKRHHLLDFCKIDKELNCVHKHVHAGYATLRRRLIPVIKSVLFFKGPTYLPTLIINIQHITLPGHYPPYRADHALRPYGALPNIPSLNHSTSHAILTRKKHLTIASTMHAPWSR